MRHGIGGEARFADEIQQQNTHFVSGDKLVLPCLIARSNAAAVAVRVCTDEKFRLLFPAKPQSSSIDSRISGLGYGQVGNFPSGFAWLGTTVTSATPSLSNSFCTHSSPLPQSGV